MNRYLICIDGIDGSGKSHLGRRIGEAVRAADLGAVTLHVDDFRQAIDWDALPAEAEGPVYYEHYYDFAALDACLASWLDGARSHPIPVFDTSTEQNAGYRELAFGDRQVMILEGVFTLRAANVRRGVLLYLTTGFDAARCRIVQRDTARGRALAEVERRIDRRYFPGQRRYHQECRPRRQAQVVIEHEQLGALRPIRIDLDGAPPRVALLLRSILSDLAPECGHPGSDEAQGP